MTTGCTLSSKCVLRLATGDQAGSDAGPSLDQVSHEPGLDEPGHKTTLRSDCLPADLLTTLLLLQWRQGLML